MMRRSNPWLAAALALVFALCTSTARAQGKIVFVSSGRIFEGAPGWQKAEDQFTRGYDSVHVVERRMNDSLNVLLEAYAGDEPTLAADARATRRSAIERQRGIYQQRGEQMEKAVQARRSIVMDSITTRVRSALAQLRRAKGYAAILDFDAGGIIAADPSRDVTSEVIAAMK
jgi:Skp family chaperone for outer membrane proteins